MSLGLGDLKKKKSSSPTARVVKSVDVETSPVTQTAMQEKYPAGAWAGGARPWSSTELSAESRPRRRKNADLSDIAMNDEASQLQAAPLFFFDLAGDSRLARVEATLVKVEERVTRALEGPLRATQMLFPKFFAQK